ncbi:hypothetical protein FRC11_009074 [Ceratobasidium sp. 423]|nr:hypothetical protein FRC11_009074 [Ceratobasidium sp. 423]
MQSQLTASSTNVHFMKEALEVFLNLTNRSQAKSNNALICMIKVTASIIKKAGGKHKTHCQHKAKVQGLYLNTHQQMNPNPNQPRHHAKKKNKQNTHQGQHQSHRELSMTYTTQTTPAMLANTTTTPPTNLIAPMTKEKIRELENLQHILSISEKTPEAQNTPQQPPAPAYTPPAPPSLPTQPIQNTLTPKEQVVQVQNLNTYTGTYLSQPPKETIDYDKDYPMEAQAAH